MSCEHLQYSTEPPYSVIQSDYFWPNIAIYSQINKSEIDNQAIEIHTIHTQSITSS